LGEHICRAGGARSSHGGADLLQSLPR
jgi:hypothetical protein